MMAKLQDVANLANVSPTTVSRVINKRGYISSRTRRKVCKAMKQLNYEPNTIARSLTGKNTDLIGLIFYNTSNPFFGELVSDLERKLFLRGYRTILCNSANSPEKEKKYLDMLSANKVDGIITGTHNLNITEYDKIQAPIVSFDRNLSYSIPIVSSDNFMGGYKATNYLIKAGCTKIHLFTSSKHSSNPTDDRVKGYLEALKSRNLQPHVHELGFGTNPEKKEHLIKEILKSQQIDGVFCTDDLTAIMTYNIANQVGIKVPKQLNIVGYDGTKFVQSYFPWLPTIKQPLDEISNCLVDLLIKRIHHEKIEKNTHIALPISLIVT